MRAFYLTTAADNGPKRPQPVTLHGTLHARVCTRVPARLYWLGHLPGDIRVEGERTRVYVPITSMLIVSVVLTLALWLVRRLGGSS